MTAILTTSLLWLGGYALLFRLLDRYRRITPARALTGLLWGALPAFGLAYALEGLVFGITRAWLAPVIEEIAKGLGLLLTLHFWRRDPPSPLTGLLCGAWIGLGFTLAETVLHTTAGYAALPWLQTFRGAVARAGVFGLNHALYTGALGLGLAHADSAHRAGWAWLWRATGAALSVLAHGGHNLLATVAGNRGNFYALLPALLFVTLAGCAFIACIAAFLWEGQQVTRYARRLCEHGQLDKAELSVLTYATLRGVTRWTALFSGKPGHWHDLGAYYRAFDRAAFTWAQPRRHRALWKEQHTRWLEIRVQLNTHGQGVIA